MANGWPARAWADFRIVRGKAVGFHLLMQAAAVAVLTPLVVWLARSIIATTGDAVVSNFDIAAFLLSPRGLAFVLVVAACGLAILLAEFAGLTWLAGHAIGRRPVTLAGTVAHVARTLPALLGLSTRIFLRLVLLVLPALALLAALWFTTLGAHDVNYYLAEDPPEFRRAKRIAAVAALATAVAVAVCLARWLYALPLMLHRACPPGEALRGSWALTRGGLRRLLPPLLLWWASLAALVVAASRVAGLLTGPALAWAGMDPARVLPLVSLFLVVSTVFGLLVGALQLGGHQFLVTRLYAEQSGAAALVPDGPAATPASSTSLARVAVAATLALLAASVGTAAWLLRRLDLTPDVAITAHRGASRAAPENSLPAFRAALEAGADFVELDVQRTRDGALIVMHDGDFMRMAGDPRKVAQVTAAEAARIDIGRRFDARFAGEHPPLLSEVLALLRGRMRVNVELKYNVPDPALAPAVVELLRRERFLDQAVITSLDYAALKQVKALEPRLPTGHIVTAAVGNVTRTAADFLSLNARRATPELLRKARAAGKQVHVWTVDRPEDMQRMIERGVDNIITNEPARLRRLLDEREALDAPERLALRLRVLFTQLPPAPEAPTGGAAQ